MHHCERIPIFVFENATFYSKWRIQIPGIVLVRHVKIIAEQFSHGKLDPDIEALLEFIFEPDPNRQVQVEEPVSTGCKSCSHAGENVRRIWFRIQIGKLVTERKKIVFHLTAQLKERSFERCLPVHGENIFRVFRIAG